MSLPDRKRIVELLRRARESSVVQIIAVLVLYRALWLWFMVIGQLPESAYRGGSIALGVAESPFLALFIVANTGLIAGFRRRLSWKSIDERMRARWFVLVPVAAMTLQFCAYDINAFYGQSHVFDRLLLLVLAGCCVVHPLFVHLWFGLMAAIVGQLNYPLEEPFWMWADKRLLFDFIVMFHCFLYVRLVFNTKPRLLAILALILTGATYFYAGLSKMQLGPSWYSWLADNELSNVVVSSYSNSGWLRGLGDEGIVRFAGVIDTVGRPMLLITLLLELAGLTLFFGRRVAMVALAGFVAMHLGILATTGIFFWKWAVFDIALLLYVRTVCRGEQDERPVPGWWRWRWRPLFGAPVAAVAFAATIWPTSWSSPTGFGWYDSPVANYFEFRGVSASGNTYTLDPDFFAPYDMMFAQSRFYFLVQYPVLADTFGSVRDHRLARALRGANPEGLEAIRKTFGRIYFDPRRAEVFGRFVSEFVSSAQRRGRRTIPVLSWIAPPYHFQSTSHDDTYDLQEPLVGVEVWFHEQFFDGERIHRIVARPIGRIQIAPRLP